MTTTATGEQTAPAPLPPMGPVGFLRWCWRQLTSMRTALILLFLLALASIPGSLLPQRTTDPVRVSDWLRGNPAWGPVLDRLGFFDVYGSPWFAATYLLLFVSLVGCVVPRTRQHLAALRARPPAAPRRLSRLPVSRSWTVDDSAGDPAEAAADWLRSRRWRVETGVDDSGEWVAAEKGYAKETGNLVFHAALLLLLVSIGAGALWGWKGNVIVHEGAGFSDTLTQYDAWGGGRLVDPQSLPPFSFTLEDFRVEFERGAAQRGSPRLFEAEVDYASAPGVAQQRAVIGVNEPLVVDGTKVFLVGHGYAPRFVVRDSDGKVVFDDEVTCLPQDGMFTSTCVVKVPDASLPLGFQAIFAPTAVVDEERGPHSVFPAPDNPVAFVSAWTGDLGLDSGVPQSVYTLKTAGMTQVGLEAIVPGETWTLPEGFGSIEFAGVSRWASFQVARDPGKEAALLAALLAIAGLVLTTLTRRRRVWVRVSRDDSGRRLAEAGGLSKGEPGGLDDEVAELSAAAGMPPD